MANLVEDASAVAETGVRVAAAARIITHLLNHPPESAAPLSPDEQTLRHFAASLSDYARNVLCRRLQLFIDHDIIHSGVVPDDDVAAWTRCISDLVGKRPLNTTPRLSLLASMVADPAVDMSRWLHQLRQEVEAQPDEPLLIQQLQMVAFIATHPRPCQAARTISDRLVISAGRTHAEEMHAFAGGYVVSTAVPTFEDPVLTVMLRETCKGADAGAPAKRRKL